MRKFLLVLLFISTAALAQDAKVEQEPAFIDTGDSLYIKSHVVDAGQCFGFCASQQGQCIARCQGDGQCIGFCAADHGRCVANCN